MLYLNDFCLAYEIICGILTKFSLVRKIQAGRCDYLWNAREFFPPSLPV